MPSRIFEDVFDSGSGGCYRDCQCGRVHFDNSYDSGWDWEEGELERLLERETQMPDKFISHDHAIGTMIIDGIEIVYDCPCDGMGKYEDFIKTYSDLLALYLNKRAQALRDKADRIEITE